MAKIVEDRDAGRPGTPSLPDAEGIVTWLAERSPDAVTWEGWQAIDAAECAAGEAEGARA